MANEKDKPAPVMLTVCIAARIMRELKPRVDEWRREFPVPSKNAAYCKIAEAAAIKFEELLKTYPIAEEIEVNAPLDGWRALNEFCLVVGWARYSAKGDTGGLHDLGGRITKVLSAYDNRELRVVDQDDEPDETAKAAAALRQQESAP
jgi:hypothetical protein